MQPEINKYVYFVLGTILFGLVAQLLCPPPTQSSASCDQILTMLNAKTPEQAAEKLRTIDKLFRDFDAQSIQDVRNNFKLGMQRMEKLFYAIATALAIVPTEEENPYSLTQKIILSVDRLVSIIQQMQGQSKVLAQYIQQLQGIIQKTIIAKKINNQAALMATIPDAVPANPLVKK